MGVAQVAFAVSTCAQTIPSESVSVSLLPLESRTVGTLSTSTALSSVAETVNTRFWDEQALNQLLESQGTLQFEEIPIIGELFTPAGELSVTSSLPISVSVGSVLDSYGVVISKDMDMSLLGSSPDPLPPLER